MEKIDATFAKDFGFEPGVATESFMMHCLRRMNCCSSQTW